MIYEFGCNNCGHEWEVEQKVSDPNPKSCPKCKKRKVKKLISKNTFQLLGGSWAKDSYK